MWRCERSHVETAGFGDGRQKRARRSFSVGSGDDNGIQFKVRPAEKIEKFAHGRKVEAHSVFAEPAQVGQRFVKRHGTLRAGGS
jgi:hypothetical protein